jgi:hypothetical protein
MRSGGQKQLSALREIQAESTVQCQQIDFHRVLVQGNRALLPTNFRYINVLNRMPQKSKDMQRMPPTTEPLSRIFLDETFFWTRADEKERQAVRAHNSSGTRYGRSSNTQFRTRGFAERKRHRLNRIGSI